MNAWIHVTEQTGKSAIVGTGSMMEHLMCSFQHKSVVFEDDHNSYSIDAPEFLPAGTGYALILREG